jgi:DNA polymerase III subunit epsilon
MKALARPGGIMNRLRSWVAHFFEKANDTSQINETTLHEQQVEVAIEQNHLPDIDSSPPLLLVREGHQRCEVPPPQITKNLYVDKVALKPIPRHVVSCLCPRCGNTGLLESAYHYCRECEDQWAIDREQAVYWAHKVLSPTTAANYVVLDTETTGKEQTSEVVQIGVLGIDGRILLDTLVRPQRSIPIGATRIHHITNEMIVDAPTFPEIYRHLADILTGRTVIVYNVEYDRAILENMVIRYRLPLLPVKRWTCAMKGYARFCGEWNSYFGDYRWHKLQAGDHSALGDCRATLALVEQMASLFESFHDQIDQPIAREVGGQLELVSKVGDSIEFSTGMKVRHSTFGVGVVVSSKKFGDDEEVTVGFVGQGMKRLLASYANLEVI